MDQLESPVVNIIKTHAARTSTPLIEKSRRTTPRLDLIDQVKVAVSMALGEQQTEGERRQRRVKVEKKRSDEIHSIKNSKSTKKTREVNNHVLVKLEDTSKLPVLSRDMRRDREVVVVEEVARNNITNIFANRPELSETRDNESYELNMEPLKKKIARSKMTMKRKLKNIQRLASAKMESSTQHPSKTSRRCECCCKDSSADIKPARGAERTTQKNILSFNELSMSVSSKVSSKSSGAPFEYNLLAMQQLASIRKLKRVSTPQSSFLNERPAKMALIQSDDITLINSNSLESNCSSDSGLCHQIHPSSLASVSFLKRQQAKTSLIQDNTSTLYITPPLSSSSSSSLAAYVNSKSIQSQASIEKVKRTAKKSFDQFERVTCRGACATCHLGGESECINESSKIYMSKQQMTTSSPLRGMEPTFSSTKSPESFLADSCLNETNFLSSTPLLSSMSSVSSSLKAKKSKRSSRKSIKILGDCLPIEEHVNESASEQIDHLNMDCKECMREYKKSMRVKSSEMIKIKLNYLAKQRKQPRRLPRTSSLNSQIEDEIETCEDVQVTRNHSQKSYRASKHQSLQSFVNSNDNFTNFGDFVVWYV